MSPTKKRKADASKDTNGTPSRKKKMSQKEKQEALERAKSWASDRKASAAPATAAKPAATKPRATAAASSTTKKTKSKKLQEAQARAAAWAAEELQSPQKKQPARRTPAKTTASIPPMLATNSAPATSVKKSPAKVSKKKEATKKGAAVKKTKSDTATTAVDTAVPVNQQEEPQKQEEQQQKTENGETTPVKTKRSWGFVAKLVVAVGVLVVSLGLAVCAMSCPASTDVCALCNRFKTVLHLEPSSSESVEAVNENAPVTESDEPENVDMKKSANNKETVQAPVVDDAASESASDKETAQAPLVDDTASETTEEDELVLEDWQKCRIFVAPSKLPGGGWGVFAAQNFEQNQMVEVPPMFLPVKHGTPVVKNSVLDDYVYGYLRDDPEEHMAAVSLGYITMYNHGVEPNVRWSGFGKEPDSENPNNAKGVGFVATRDIEAGEELFGSYGLEDGGVRWFETRRLERQILNTDEAKLTPRELEVAMQYQCPKLFGGYGKQAFESRVLNATPPNHIPKDPTGGMPERNAGFNNVIAKVPLKPGDLIEQVPALTLHKDYVIGTALAPLVFAWNALGGSHRINLRGLREEGPLKIQHQSTETDWRRVDQWDGYENLVILPAVGTIAMVERAGINAESANCRLEISGSGSGEGSAPLALRLVATDDVKTGEILRLNMNAGGTSAERIELRKEMQRTGQPLFWIRKNV